MKSPRSKSKARAARTEHAALSSNRRMSAPGLRQEDSRLHARLEFHQCGLERNGIPQMVLRSRHRRFRPKPSSARRGEVSRQDQDSRMAFNAWRLSWSSPLAQANSASRAARRCSNGEDSVASRPPRTILASGAGLELPLPSLSLSSMRATWSEEMENSTIAGTLW
jgi:hypothetical protein